MCQACWHGCCELYWNWDKNTVRHLIEISRQWKKSQTKQRSAHQLYKVEAAMEKLLKECVHSASFGFLFQTQERPVNSCVLMRLNGLGEGRGSWEASAGCSKINYEEKPCRAKKDGVSSAACESIIPLCFALSSPPNPHVSPSFPLTLHLLELSRLQPSIILSASKSPWTPSKQLFS